MRNPSRLALLSLAALFAAPATAYPCSIALGVFDWSPRNADTLPANGQLLFSVSPSNASPVYANLLGENGQMDVPLSTSPLGQYMVVVDLPRLNGPATVDVGMTEYNNVGQTIDLNPSDLDDLTPPTPPGNFTLRAEYAANDICFGSGYWVYASFTTGSDDFALAAHLLSEVQPDDGIEVIGVNLEHNDVTTPLREFGVFLAGRGPPTPGEQLCLTLGALDRAGNASPSRGNPFACAKLAAEPPPPKDGGVDAGTIDGGTVERDGGTPSDAGPAADAGPTRDSGIVPTAPPLLPAGPECACTAVPSADSPRSVPMGALAFGFVFFWFGRRRRLV